jgi:hypothetical protein
MGHAFQDGKSLQLHLDIAGFLPKKIWIRFLGSAYLSDLLLEILNENLPGSSFPLKSSTELADFSGSSHDL